MISVPTIFERHNTKRTVVENYVPLNAAHFHEWTAMERMPGADVRVTVRNSVAVRLEVVNKPTSDQKKMGIVEPWFRDCNNAGADYWLLRALENTDFSDVPDGEWEGEAVGDSIAKNPLQLEAQTILLSSLFPWREDHPEAPVPPALGRTPFEYADLRFWLSHTESIYAGKAGVPIDGLVWWWNDTPVAQIRARDFGEALGRRPNQ
jgi:hypothetical protein